MTRVELKESQKKDKYPDLARELKRLLSMKVTIIPIVIGILGTVIKGLIKGLEDLEIRGREETIQTTELLRSPRILRRVLKNLGLSFHSNSCEKPSANAGVKNMKRSYNNNKILSDFEVQIDYLIPARKPNLMLINKKS